MDRKEMAERLNEIAGEAYELPNIDVTQYENSGLQNVPSHEPEYQFRGRPVNLGTVLFAVAELIVIEPETENV